MNRQVVFVMLQKNNENGVQFCDSDINYGVRLSKIFEFQYSQISQYEANACQAQSSFDSSRYVGFDILITRALIKCKLYCSSLLKSKCALPNKIIPTKKSSGTELHVLNKAHENVAGKDGDPVPQSRRLSKTSEALKFRALNGAL